MALGTAAAVHQCPHFWGNPPDAEWLTGGAAVPGIALL